MHLCNFIIVNIYIYINNIDTERHFFDMSTEEKRTVYSTKIPILSYLNKKQILNQINFC